MTNEEIGKRLRKEREKKGYSIIELASLTGLRPEHLSKYENGKIKTSVRKYNQIAKIYGLELQLVITFKKIK